MPSNALAQDISGFDALLARFVEMGREAAAGWCRPARRATPLLRWFGVVLRGVHLAAVIALGAPLLAPHSMVVTRRWRCSRPVSRWWR